MGKKEQCIGTLENLITDNTNLTKKLISSLSGEKGGRRNISNASRDIIVNTLADQIDQYFKLADELDNIRGNNYSTETNTVTNLNKFVGVANQTTDTIHELRDQHFHKWVQAGRPKKVIAGLLPAAVEPSPEPQNPDIKNPNGIHLTDNNNSKIEDDYWNNLFESNEDEEDLEDWYDDDNNWEFDDFDTNAPAATNTPGWTHAPRYSRVFETNNQTPPHQNSKDDTEPIQVQTGPMSISHIPLPPKLQVNRPNHIHPDRRGPGGGKLVVVPAETTSRVTIFRYFAEKHTRRFLAWFGKTSYTFGLQAMRSAAERYKIYRENH